MATRLDITTTTPTTTITTSITSIIIIYFKVTTYLGTKLKYETLLFVGQWIPSMQ